jgi:hypothetical protein
MRRLDGSPVLYGRIAADSIEKAAVSRYLGD